MDLKTFEFSTPINYVQKRGKSDSLKSATTLTCNDSGYFTPSPAVLGSGSTGDSQDKREYLILDETPVTRGRLRSFNFENNVGGEFTQLKADFDEESPCCIKSMNKLQPLDRLHGNLFKSQKEHSRKKRQSHFVSPHSIGTLVGESKVDIIKKLSALNLRNIASLIIKSVDDCDLCAMCCASMQWKDAVISDLMARERRKIYLEGCAREKENKNEPDAKPKMCIKKASRSLLDDIQNIHSNRLESAENVETVDPAESELKHYKQFVEVARHLKPNEILEKCPRCASPARVNSQRKRAICSVSGCEFDYCTLCRCEYNFRHHCSPVKVSSRRITVPSRSRSKKLLRRLLS